MLVTHDSFALPDDLISQFESDTGLTLDVRTQGDAGSMVNQLVLTKDAPIGDVVFGIDNTFASRAIDAGVLAPYRATLPAGAEQYVVGDSGDLTPIDVGDVCVNADVTWFADHDLPVPQTLEDLTKPEYQDLLVVENPATSSPGLAFLLATVGAFGADGWQAYWQKLVDNKVDVAASWSDAYYVDFSGPSERAATSPWSSPTPRPRRTRCRTEPRRRPPRRCWTPASVRSSTRACSPARRTPTARRRSSTGCCRPRCRPRSRRACTSTRWTPRCELPESWVQFAPMAEQPYTVDPRRHRRRTATRGSRPGRTWWSAELVSLR